MERRRLLGIEDADTPSRDDLAEALEQVTFCVFDFVSKCTFDINVLS